MAPTSEHVKPFVRIEGVGKTFEMLQEVGLLPYLLPEAAEALAEEGERLLGSLSRLDDYRNAGLAAAEDLSNAVLLGTLMVPLGLSLRRPAPGRAPRGRGERGHPMESLEAGDPADGPDSGETEEPIDVAAEMAALGETEPPEGPGPSASGPLLVLPFARRDLDRLRLILAAQSRLREIGGSPRMRHVLAGRGYLDDALRWMEVHGGVQGRELAAEWRRLQAREPEAEAEAASSAAGDEASPRGPAPSEPRRRRRRRRHRRRPRPAPPASSTA